MQHEVFTDENGVSFIVITDWGDKKRSEEAAIRYAANYHFKIKKDKLECFPVFMRNPKSNLVYFKNEKGTKKYLAVGRK